MITVPMTVILLITAVFLIKYAKHKIGGVVVGVLLGLSLASTSVGPSILSGMTSLSRTVIDAASSAMGHR